MEQMNFKPIGDRVLVEPNQQEEKTAGGLFIPDTAKEKPSEGKVVAVGAGIYDSNGKRIALDVKVGDRVLFKKWGADEVKLDGKELVILKESDILAVVE